MSAATVSMPVTAQFSAPAAQFGVPSWKSIYVPSIPHDLAIDGNSMTKEETIRDYFENKLKLGVINRVDMVCRQSGAASNIVSTSAFVHFERLNDDQESQFRFAEIENGAYKANGYKSADNKYQFFVRTSTRASGIPFISIKVNHKPLPAAVETLNVHQLVAMKNEMEKRMMEMERENAELRVNVQEMQRENIELRFELENYQSPFNNV